MMHLNKRSFSSIPMKQSTVGSTVRLVAPLDHRVKDLSSFHGSSILAEIAHQRVISEYIWFNTIPAHPFENPNSVIGLS
ncbi:Os08g0107650 [Oryza sativa Japonica Group]|uniref:Os08g0107650 protein n=1 Tax=Oryza sativa subsp. japonica TaxID=39947 RepID=A0A0P0XB10_ORYSJ|nr:Os08g0107650 [Oryza sativa Japonica Group]